MGVIAWAGLRQIEALRDSVALNLSFGALPKMIHNFNAESLKTWLHQHGMGETASANADDPRFIAIRPAMDQYFSNRFGDAFEVLQEMRRSAHEAEDDFGVDRSGAGWRRLDKFIITSAFVRLLGASETFEIDTLKALLYYRPSGSLGHPLDQETVTATSDVVLEEPDPRGYYCKPALWTWIKQYAQNNEQRSAILKRVFEIQTVPAPYTVEQRKTWYAQRNSIAHGRGDVEIKLSVYCDVEVFVAKSIRAIADQCDSKLKLVI